LLFGLLLLASIVCSLGAKRIHVPKVVGYLLAGVVVKLLVQWYLRAQDPQLDAEHLANSLIKPLRPVNDLALGLILFTLGTVFETAHIKSVAGRILKIHVGEVGATFLGVFVGCSVLSYLALDTGITLSVTAGLLLGTIAMETAPAATLLVLQEYDAKGPTSDTILSLVGLNNIVCIVHFHVIFLILVTVKVIHAPYIDQGRSLAMDLLLTTVGSAVFGLTIGILFSVLQSKLTLPEMLAFFLAVLIGLGEGCEYFGQHFHLSFNFLLTTLFMGIAFCNLAIDSEKLFASIRSLGLPIFATFFAIAGFELHLGELRHLGVVGIGYVVFRTLGKYWGTRWGLWRSRSREDSISQQAPAAMGAGMWCHAGVAIGLITFLKSQWGTITDGVFVPHPLASTIATIVLGSVVIFEIIGPLATKWTAVRAGEVTVLSLLGRGPGAAPGYSGARLIMASLARLIRYRSQFNNRSTGQLQVKHIMRTNVKLLPASATFDEVLHFIERSRFNSFPVVDDEGSLLGIVRLADIRDIMYDPTTLGLITAFDLADPSLPRAFVEQSVDDLLSNFGDSDIGAIPVTQSADSRTVVGIIEQRDVLRALHISTRNKTSRD
jgi:Kef-type K+ transport system membrane component KefB